MQPSRKKTANTSVVYSDAPVTHSNILPALTFVKARRDDMNLIAGFLRSSSDWYRQILDDKDMGEHDVDENWAEKNFQRRQFYIGLAEDDPVVTVSLQYFGDIAYIGYIYLDINHVGKGYGRQFIDFAAAQAKNRGMRGMALICHPQATWAKKAYLKYGFELHASSKEEVLQWKDGILKPYYEEGFQLYLYFFQRP